MSIHPPIARQQIFAGASLKRRATVVGELLIAVERELPEEFPRDPPVGLVIGRASPARGRRRAAILLGDCPHRRLPSLRAHGVNRRSLET